MAYANNSQRRVVVFPNHQFVDLRTPNSPLTFIPVHRINPSFVPVVPQFIHVNPVSFALNLEGWLRMEAERSVALLQFMADEHLVPSPEEEIRRKFVIDQLKQIVMKWIKRVAYQRRLPRSCIAAASATILTYGSYGLGVHNAESDMDALCIGPYFATMAEDFFIVLHNMLASRPEVSEIHCVKDAKVPLMRFKFDGISIDLPYAQLKVPSVPENVDILNPVFLVGINETSWRSLSGVRANKSILQLVPNVEIFQSLLRCVKLWAKRRGVYGNLLGFFGGVHLAILAAFICQRNPDASLASLLSIFFKTFAFWPWPTPVILLDGMILPIIPSETRFLMPIQLPCTPNEYCHSNITRSTFYRIRAELLRGNNMMKDLLKPGFDWSGIFERFYYSRKYSRFAQICISASDRDALGDWAGWIKSRFRSLLLKLEEVQGFCDPNPSEYVDMSLSNPNVVFYWGLQPGKSDNIDINYVEADFMKNLNNGYQGPRGEIRLSVVQASQLPKEEYFDIGSSNKAIKPSWRDYSKSSDQKVPVYSKHMPQYFVGYMATDGNSGG